MNVIVIVCDSLRRDHLGCYGNDWIRTPNIDRFATESLVFDQAFSEGLPTLPARTAMWTGRYTLPFRGWRTFDHDDILLAEWLWDKGFTTSLITDVYHMHKPGMNCGRGFDSVEFIRGQEYDPWIVDPSIDISAGMERHFKPSELTERTAWFREQFMQYLRNISVRKGEEDYFIPRVFNAAIRWLERMQGRDNLLLWIDSFDPHEPWDPPEEYYARYADPAYEGQRIIDPVPSPVDGYLTPAELADIKALYAGEVDFLDKWVGIFLDAAQALGYFDNSLILFTTDHGEPFGEHGIIRKGRPWNYEELVHIPFILRMPDGTGSGTRSQALVQSCDIAPTIYDFLGVPHPPGETAPSILPLVQGETDCVRRYVVTGHHGQSWTIRDRDWSFHLDIADTGKQAMQCSPDAVPRQIVAPFGSELYNVHRDPGEQNDLLPDDTDVADELELELRRFMAGLKWEQRTHKLF
ncbi:MAG: sulfatase [Armatimonadetes bacterium]|nr:sulfatase [Armatimonadota bacterium]